jgi:hypothetical protein
MRKIVGVTAIVIGLLLSVASVAVGFRASTSGERLLDGARPTMRDDVAQLRADFDTLQRGTDQTVEELIPALARELGTSTAALTAQVRDEFPRLGELFERQAEVEEALGKTVTNLEAHAGDFRAADDLPAPGVSLRVVPVVLLVAGLGTLAAGVFVLWRPGRRGLWLVAAMGALLAVPALALQAPQNASRAEQVIDSLNITEATAATTRDQFDTVDAALAEQRTRFFPAVAQALGTTTEELVAAVGEQFPAVGAALADIDGILSRIEADVAFREQNVDEFADVKNLPLGAMTWVVAAAGLLLTALAATQLVRERAGATSPATETQLAPTTA